MVKLNVISRTAKDDQRETKMDLFKVNQVISTDQHPMSQAREYQRAVVAAKIQKIFSKPFLFSLQGHSDGISSMSKPSENITKLLSGSFNGEIILWDVPLHKSYLKIDAFQ